MTQISLTFPDGNKREFPRGVTPGEVASAIATSLGKAAISASIDGQHYDLQ
jgi:threonyl-tRNA synthetase